jgi:hypothetical protein
MRVFTTSSVTNPAGGSNGAAVVVNVSRISADGVTPGLPATYQVVATPNQPNVFWSVTNKTTTGFTITLTPLSTVTVAAGTIDFIVADSGTPIG